MNFSIKLKQVQKAAKEQGLILHKKTYYRLRNLLDNGAYEKAWERGGVTCLQTVLRSVHVHLYVTSSGEVYDLRVQQTYFRVGDIVQYQPRYCGDVKTGNSLIGEVVYRLEPGEDIVEVVKALPLDNFSKRNLINKKTRTYSHKRYIVKVYDEGSDRLRYAFPENFGLTLVCRPISSLYMHEKVQLAVKKMRSWLES